MRGTLSLSTLMGGYRVESHICLDDVENQNAAYLAKQVDPTGQRTVGAYLSRLFFVLFSFPNILLISLLHMY